jgi:hypothetical protein
MQIWIDYCEGRGIGACVNKGKLIIIIIIIIIIIYHYYYDYDYYAFV